MSSDVAGVMAWRRWQVKHGLQGLMRNLEKGGHEPGAAASVQAALARALTKPGEWYDECLMTGLEGRKKHLRELPVNWATRGADSNRMLRQRHRTSAELRVLGSALGTQAETVA